MNRGRGRRHRALPAVLAGLGCLVILLAGCARPASRDIGIGPSDVLSVEVYLYAYAVEPQAVTRSVIKDRREIEDLVKAFTDMPVKALSHPSTEVLGHKAAGLRFVLREGGALELTQVFLVPNDVVVFWPDGSVVGTTWGAAIGDSGTPADPAANSAVDPSQRPSARIP